MNIVLEEGHPVDPHLRPIKIGGQSTSLELASADNGARINGDLIVTGQMDTVNVNRIVSSDLYIRDAEIITLDPAGGYVHINSGFTTTIVFDNNGATTAGAGMTFHSILDTGDYFRIDTTTHGATTISTVDDDATAGHLTIAPDGELRLNQPADTALVSNSPIFIREIASANTDQGSYGQIWVKNETPSELYYTTDAGDDIQITDGTSMAGGGGGASALNDLSDVTYSSGDLTITSLDTIIAGALEIDSSGDITLDADGDQVTMKFGGTAGQIDFTNANSGDGIIQQKVDAKDLVIHQFDGNEVVRFTDGGDVKVTNTVYFAAETANTIGDGATGVIDWNVSQKQKVTITGTSITCNFTNPAGPCNLLLKVVQGDGNDVIATWDGDIKWPTNDTVPTLSTGNGDIDIISFYFDGTNYFGVASLDFA